MLFDDSPRFNKRTVQANGDIQAYAKDNTEDHIGPGAYLSTRQQDLRSGWIKKSFSTRKNPHIGRSASRSDYMHSTLSPNGIMSSPTFKADRNTPGPGYYEGSTVYIRANSSRTKSPGPRPGSPRSKLSESLRSMNFDTAFSSKGGSLPCSPRFSFQNSTCMRGDVLFQSKLNEDQPLGPGYYEVKRDNMLKRSHNIRAQKNELNAKKKEQSSFRSFIGDDDAGLYTTFYRQPSSVRTPNSNSPKRGIPQSNSRRFFADSPVGTPEINLSADSAEKEYYDSVMKRQNSSRPSSAPRMGMRKNPSIGNINRNKSQRNTNIMA